MKYRSLSSPFNVIIMATIYTAFPLLHLLFMLISFPAFKIQGVWIILALTLVLLTIILLIYRNSYVAFEMSDSGLKNKALGLRWQDIKGYKILENSLLKYSGIKIERPSIVYFYTDEAPLPSTIFALNVKYHVWFEITPKNLKELRKYNQNRSEVINRLLDEVDSWHTDID